MGKRILLTFGIAGESFVPFLERYCASPQEWKLFCAESRPYETLLSKWVSLVIPIGCEVTIISDNMIGYCLMRKEVSRVLLFYQMVVEGWAYCQGGSLLVALLAREMRVPCDLFPAGETWGEGESDGSLSFAGRVIVPQGVKSFIPGVEEVPLSYIAKIW